MYHSFTGINILFLVSMKYWKVFQCWRDVHLFCPDWQPSCGVPPRPWRGWGGWRPAPADSTSGNKSFLFAIEEHLLLVTLQSSGYGLWGFDSLLLLLWVLPWISCLLSIDFAPWSLTGPAELSTFRKHSSRISAAFVTPAQVSDSILPCFEIRSLLKQNQSSEEINYLQ